MDPTAIELAEARLRKAKSAMRALKSATDFESAEEAWTDFLHAAAAIYSKLEQGAKTNGKSVGWYGRKKKERKDDPLLRYLHFARNSDEHGIERVTEKYDNAGRRGPLGAQPKFGQRSKLALFKIDQTTMQPIGPPVEAFYPGPSIKLVRAKDNRFNDFCDPPHKHLGNDVPAYSWPQEVGELGLTYLKNLLVEAETYV